MTAGACALVGVLCLLVLTGCGTSHGPEPVAAEANAVLPLGTVEDMVRYGDFAAVVTVTAERRLDPIEEEKQRGEGVVPRQVTLRVDNVTWRRPTLGAQRTLPATLTLTNGGWEFKDDGERPWIVSGQEYLAVGRRYVVESFGNAELGSIAEGEEATADPEWMMLAAMPVVDGNVATSNSAQVADGVARYFAGKSLSEAAQLLADTPINPYAAPYMDEDPVLRYHHQRRASASPAAR